MSCPNCGYCPHCGRSGWQFHPYYQQPYITWTVPMTSPVSAGTGMPGNAWYNTSTVSNTQENK